jgi:Methylase of chemotaxis methyl-accepting proteins
MNNNISKNVLKNVNNFIEAKFGLNFPEERFNNLIRGLSNASKQKNIDIEKYINMIFLNKLSEEELINLATWLTIGETYFFRDNKLFQIIREKILPDIINSRKYSNRSLNIWSAACSSGEEAYSIAILIKELIPDYKNWNIKIIATDINQNSLNKAKKAIYSEWSFRGVDLNFKNNYFDRVDDIYYRLKDDVINLVKFNTLNLADDTYVLDNEPINNVDIIFCRNVLMYFSKEQAHKIINRFYNIIKNEGWLIGAPTENLYFNDTSFIPINMDGVFLYNKDTKESSIVKKFDNNIKITNTSIEKEMEINYHKREMEKDTIVKNLIVSSEETNIPVKEKTDLDEFEAKCRSLANEGNLGDALEWCKKAINKYKMNPVYYHLLANIQQELENFNDAISSLKKAIYLNSDFIMAYFDLGNLNLKQEKYKEASKNFRNVHTLLDNLNEKDIIPYSDEMTVGMLKQIIDNIDYKGDSYGKL